MKKKLLNRLVASYHCFDNLKVIKKSHNCIFLMLLMSSIKNKVQLIGNLGANPEIKTMEDGKKLARMSVATNESYRNTKGEKVTDTNWHQVVAWGKTAAIVEKYLKKGSEIALEGKLVTRQYVDKDGIKKYITEIIADEILLLEDDAEYLPEKE